MKYNAQNPTREEYLIQAESRYELLLRDVNLTIKNLEFVYDRDYTRRRIPLTTIEFRRMQTIESDLSDLRRKREGMLFDLRSIRSELSRI